MENIMTGNPLLNTQSNFKVKRRYAVKVPVLYVSGEPQLNINCVLIETPKSLIYLKPFKGVIHGDFDGFGLNYLINIYCNENQKK